MFKVKRMVNEFWIIIVFQIYYRCRIVDAFRIIFGKGMMNAYWILSLFRIVCMFGMNMGI